MPSPEDPSCSRDASCSPWLSSGSSDSPSRRARASRPSARTHCRRGGGQGRGGAGGGPTPTIEDRTSGMRKIDGYFPLYWDERGGAMLLEIPRFDTPISCSRPGCRPAWARTTSVSIAARAAAGASCGSSASGREDHARPAEPVLPLEQRESARAEVGRRLVREVDPLGLHGRRRIGRPRARRRDAVLSARRDGRGRIAAAGHVSRRPDAKRVLSAEHAQLPEEHRDRHDADVRQRRGRRARRRRRRRCPRRVRSRSAPATRGGAGGGRGGGLFSGTVASVIAVGRRGDAARARVVRRAAGRQLQAARRRSARRLRRPELRRLQHADRRADGRALPPPPSSREEEIRTRR